MVPPIGICFPTEAEERVAVRGFIEAIEAGGFDHIAVGEHVLSTGATPNSFTSLSFVAR